MKGHPRRRDKRFATQRQVIAWILLAGASFLGANAWFIVHMFGPIG